MAVARTSTAGPPLLRSDFLREPRVRASGWRLLSRFILRVVPAMCATAYEYRLFQAVFFCGFSFCCCVLFVGKMRFDAVFASAFIVGVHLFHVEHLLSRLCVSSVDAILCSAWNICGLCFFYGEVCFGFVPRGAFLCPAVVVPKKCVYRVGKGGYTQMCLFFLTKTAAGI